MSDDWLDHGLPVYHGDKAKTTARKLIDRLGGPAGFKTDQQIGADGSVTIVQLKGDMPPQVRTTHPATAPNPAIYHRTFVFNIPGETTATIANRNGGGMAIRKTGFPVLRAYYSVAAQRTMPAVFWNDVIRIDADKVRFNGKVNGNAPTALTGLYIEEGSPPIPYLSNYEVLGSAPGDRSALFVATHTGVSNLGMDGAVIDSIAASGCAYTPHPTSDGEFLFLGWHYSAAYLEYTLPWVRIKVLDAPPYLAVVDSGSEIVSVDTSLAFANPTLETLSTAPAIAGPLPIYEPIVFAPPSDWIVIGHLVYGHDSIRYRGLRYAGAGTFVYGTELHDDHVTPKGWDTITKEWRSDDDDEVTTEWYPDSGVSMSNRTARAGHSLLRWTDAVQVWKGNHPIGGVLTSSPMYKRMAEFDGAINHAIEITAEFSTTSLYHVTLFGNYKAALGSTEWRSDTPHDGVEISGAVEYDVDWTIAALAGASPEYIAAAAESLITTNATNLAYYEQLVDEFYFISGASGYVEHFNQVANQAFEDVFTANLIDYLFADIQEEIFLFLETSYTSNYEQHLDAGEPSGVAITEIATIDIRFILMVRGVRHEFPVFDSTDAPPIAWIGPYPFVRPSTFMEGAGTSGEFSLPKALPQPTLGFLTPFVSQGACPYIAYTTKAEEAAGATHEIYVDFFVTLTGAAVSGVMHFDPPYLMQIVSDYFEDSAYLSTVLPESSRIQFANGVIGPWAGMVGYPIDSKLEISRI